MGPEELESALRTIGAARYHNRHPFHALLHGGKLTKGQVQAWALNRYYYQSIIPQKDAAILSRMTDRDIRRSWRQRIIDHDGDETYDGGIERWLRLTDILGFDRDYVITGAGLQPGTRFAVQAYLHFERDRSQLEAIASSLTELFAPTLITATDASAPTVQPLLALNLLSASSVMKRRYIDFDSAPARRPTEPAAVL